MCLTFAVEHLVSKPKEALDICHQKLLCIDRTLILREKEQLKYQYQIIAQESYQRDTRLSAAGFFPLDNSLIVFIISTICTNLVAICQFFSAAET